MKLEDLNPRERHLANQIADAMIDGFNDVWEKSKAKKNLEDLWEALNDSHDEKVRKLLFDVAQNMFVSGCFECTQLIEDLKRNGMARQ